MHVNVTQVIYIYIFFCRLFIIQCLKKTDKRSKLTLIITTVHRVMLTTYLFCTNI